jgi:hypothetical protein
MKKMGRILSIILVLSIVGLVFFAKINDEDGES